ncbi:copper amine oxidase N-terminal domain-containing protein [Paenibacillus sp. BR2-3]|uniref:copper amine oxidase N-terminal domain-containing protein n=1 Tax=Paenibacillus sp. BR2-3 TaxID=3048494 RepID=UPI003977A099
MMKKNMLALVFGLGLLIPGGTLYSGVHETVLAAPEITSAAAVTAAANTPVVIVNGKKLMLADAPFTKQGRLLVPLRGVAEGFGASVTWNKATRTASVTRGVHEAQLTAGSTAAVKDGIAVKLDVPAEIRSGRIYIPLRFSAESMGGLVSWNASTATASITMPLTPAAAQLIIQDRAEEAVTALKEKDWESLQALSSPKGVRFSPYGYVNTSSDRLLSHSSLTTAPLDNTAYLWGSYDGSGDPIKLNFAQYYDRFIYSSDFAAAPQIGYNVTIGTGNTLDNSRNIYPNAIIVEYHYDGFDPQYAGMDWQSLRLVFGKEGSQWVLVGIIHDQWTI